MLGLGEKGEKARKGELSCEAGEDDGVKGEDVVCGSVTCMDCCCSSFSPVHSQHRLALDSALQL